MHTPPTCAQASARLTAAWMSRGVVSSSPPSVLLRTFCPVALNRLIRLASCSSAAVAMTSADSRRAAGVAGPGATARPGAASPLLLSAASCERRLAAACMRGVACPPALARCAPSATALDCRSWSIAACTCSCVMPSLRICAPGTAMVNFRLFSTWSSCRAVAVAAAQARQGSRVRGFNHQPDALT